MVNFKINSYKSVLSNKLSLFISSGLLFLFSLACGGGGGGSSGVEVGSQTVSLVQGKAIVISGEVTFISANKSKSVLYKAADRVVLENLKSGSKQTTNINSDGTYSIEAIKNEQYMLTAFSSSGEMVQTLLTGPKENQKVDVNENTTIVSLYLISTVERALQELSVDEMRKKMEGAQQLYSTSKSNLKDQQASQEKRRNSLNMLSIREMVRSGNQNLWSTRDKIKSSLTNPHIFNQYSTRAIKGILEERSGEVYIPSQSSVDIKLSDSRELDILIRQLGAQSITSLPASIQETIQIDSGLKGEEKDPIVSELIPQIPKVKDPIIEAVPEREDPLTKVNHSPIASIEVIGNAEIGETLILDASSSYDIDGEPLTYSWKQIFGRKAKLVHSNSAKTSFKVESTSEPLFFQLKVSDGELESEPQIIKILVTSIRE